MKSFLKFETFIGMAIVSLSLIYYCFKYYQQGQLFFVQNQFVIFIVFALIIFWIFGYVIWQNLQLKAQVTDIQDNNIIIKDLLEVIMTNDKNTRDDIQNNHYNLVKMSNNTRQLFLEYFNKNDIKRGVEEYEGK